jgi:hypothetical protein
MKAAIGQLDANGDCLYATMIARQIKADHPECHLTWWISSRCAHLLECNPFIDDVIVIPVPNWESTSREVAWATLKSEMLRTQAGPEPFDRVWVPQIFPGNFRFFDGTVRPSMVRSYGGKITVPVDPVIRLTPREHGRVAEFSSRHRLEERRHVVLFECSSNSGQSHVTPEFAIKVADRLAARLPDVLVLLSTMRPLGRLPSHVVSAGELTMRENLALLDHCSCFVGCGSGLTVVATCDDAKPLPNVQILSASRSVLASFRHDFEYWGKPVERFIELPDGTASAAAACIERCLVEGLAAARAEFHEPVPVTFDFLFKMVETALIQRGLFIDAAESLAHTRARYPDRPEIRAFALGRVLPLCRHDVRATLPAAIRQMEFVSDQFRSSSQP